MVIRLLLPDDAVRERLKQESPEDIEQQLKDYHREIDFVRLYFPQADIHDVEAAKSPAEVAEEVRKVLSK